MLYGTVTEFCTPQEVRNASHLSAIQLGLMHIYPQNSARSCLQALGQSAAALHLLVTPHRAPECSSSRERQIRIPVGRRGTIQEGDEAARAGVRRRTDELGARTA